MIVQLHCSRSPETSLSHMLPQTIPVRSTGSASWNDTRGENGCRAHRVFGELCRFESNPCWNVLKYAFCVFICDSLESWNCWEKVLFTIAWYSPNCRFGGHLTTQKLGDNCKPHLRYQAMWGFLWLSYKLMPSLSRLVPWHIQYHVRAHASSQPFGANTANSDNSLDRRLHRMGRSFQAATGGWGFVFFKVWEGVCSEQAGKFSTTKISRTRLFATLLHKRFSRRTTAIQHINGE